MNEQREPYLAEAHCRNCGYNNIIAIDFGKPRQDKVICEKCGNLAETRVYRGLND